MAEEKLIDILNSTIKVLNNDNVTKQSLIPYCEKIETFLLNDFKNIEEPETIQLFRYDTNERLSQINDKIKKFKDKPECCIFEAVKVCQEQIHKFLDVYHIGFNRNISLQNNGYLKVEIGCLITKHNEFHENDLSSKIKLQLQMETLQNLGINISYKNIDELTEPEIVADSNSIDALYTLLGKELNAENIKMDIIEFEGRRSINKIYFSVYVKDLFSNQWEMPDIVLKSKENCLNPDEIGSIYYDIKEINHAYGTINMIEDISQTCVSLIKSHFSNICKVIGFNGEIKKEYDKKYSEIRKLNDEIRKKELELGNMICENDIDGILKNAFSMIEKIVFEKTNFRSTLIKATPYNIIANFTFATGFNLNRKMKQMTDEEIRNMYDCSKEGTIRDEDLFLLCTERNLKTLEDTITSNIPLSTITDMNIKNHWSIKQNYINNFSLSIDNLNVLF